MGGLGGSGGGSVPGWNQIEVTERTLRQGGGHQACQDEKSKNHSPAGGEALSPDEQNEENQADKETGLGRGLPSPPEGALEMFDNQGHLEFNSWELTFWIGLAIVLEDLFQLGDFSR